MSMFDPRSGRWEATVVPALATAQDRRLELDFTAHFKRTEAKLDRIYHALEDCLVHTPFSQRLWDGKPILGQFPGQSIEIFDHGDQ
jgi:hypothetical protein